MYTVGNRNIFIPGYEEYFLHHILLYFQKNVPEICYIITLLYNKDITSQKFQVQLLNLKIG
jgi:hypothetical protein